MNLNGSFLLKEPLSIGKQNARLSAGVFRQNLKSFTRLNIVVSCRTFCVFVRLSGKHLPDGRDAYLFRVALAVTIAYFGVFVNQIGFYIAKVSLML